MNINSQINIDNISYRYYNKFNLTNKESFTLFDYYKYKKYEEIKDLILKDKNEKYERTAIKTTNVNNEHDKIFRKILSEKTEAVKFINEHLKTKLNVEVLEKYNTNYISSELKNQEADIVYKIKNKEEFILIEHQSKIDYEIPLRILKYQVAIIESAINNKKLKRKDYKYPLVRTIVLYTGKRKWNAKNFIEEMQLEPTEGTKVGFGKYKIVDVDEYSPKTLLENNSFITKAMLIEKAKNNEEIALYIDEIIEEINKNAEEYSQNIKEILLIILNQILKKKIGEEKTNELIKKINNGGDKDMMAVFETIEEDNKRIYRKGKKDGILQGMNRGMAQGISQGISYNIPYNVDTIKKGYPILCA